jgi:hypothetical protein
MRSDFLASVALLCCLAAGNAQTRPVDAGIPHLERHGQAVQLIVDGKPFLALAGELSNTVSSDTERMKTVWSLLANKVHMNTVLTGVSWDWIEPEEGKYDFRLIDQIIEGARQNNVRIVWLWFASWKNGLSSFALPGSRPRRTASRAPRSATAKPSRCSRPSAGTTSRQTRAHSPRSCATHTRWIRRAA